MKNSQIILLVLLFVVCGALGFFLGKVFVGADNHVSQEVIVEEVVEEPVVVLSTIPVIDDVTPPVGKRGVYEFSVKGSVESGDAIIYGLYSDEGCSVKVAENLDGVFTGIAGTDSKKYYVMAQNYRTSDTSDIVVVEGFAKLHMFRKILESELEQLFNVTRSWSDAPEWMSASVSASMQLQIVNLDPEREPRATKTLGEVCMKVANGQWESVDVRSMSYDIQNRLQKLTIAVNYPM
ncbi:MAG: hypothetical protein J6A22_07265 [Bacteroidales bacterium]|nr:hypothetical protein [Bacteroidales bacterium]